MGPRESNEGGTEDDRQVSRRRFLQGAAGAAVGAVAGRYLPATQPALAAGITCPNPNPIVNENRCTTSGWSPGFQMAAGTYSGSVSGWASASSVNRGQPIDIRLIHYGAPISNVTLQVYRLGCYGGRGGRLVALAVAPVTTNPSWTPPDVYGRGRFDNGAVPVAVTLGAGNTAVATAVSGVYIVKIVWNESGATRSNQIVYVVRDDARKRDLLVAMPTNTWQAYNNWGGKSLYYYNSNGPPDGAPLIFDQEMGGGSKALKVSHERPYANVYSDYNWVLRTEFPLIYWLEASGYDLAYTDDVAVHRDGSQLLPAKTKTYVVAGHSEYWTKEMFDNVETARNAGTNIASFSANTCYWKVRYEDNERTVACFKTIENQGSSPVPGPSITPDQATGAGFGCNDFGPESVSNGQRRSSVDPLGPAGAYTGGGDARPDYATTTFRDTGEPAGGSSTPANNSANTTGAGHGAGRVGPGRPESNLFGILYIGDDDAVSYGLKVPAGTGNGGEFGAHPAWRFTDVTTAGTTVGTNYVGWEWDAIPRAGIYWPAFGSLPVPVNQIKRISDTLPTGSGRSYLRDLGRERATTPPPWQPATTQAVTWTHPGGARVFAAGTIQWSWGLGPHFLNSFDSNYEAARTDSSTLRMRQATTNILKDMGVVPATPAADIRLS